MGESGGECVQERATSSYDVRHINADIPACAVVRSALQDHPRYIAVFYDSIR